MSEFITSQEDFANPQSAEEHPQEWWNIWQKRLWPYSKMMIGDTLYWYVSSKRVIIASSKVTGVDRFHYESKADLFVRLQKFFGHAVNIYDAYTTAKPDQGYCLVFQVEVGGDLNIPRPADQKFPRDGWLELTCEKRRAWFGGPRIEDPGEPVATLDDYLPDGSPSTRVDLFSRLRELNQTMQDVNPERLKQLIDITIRNDSPIVQALKVAAGFQCQFPGCTANIQRKDGTPYVEVAHIEPVANGGKSVLGNLLVLCPNHHKEFDLGNREISHQNLLELIGRLNGREFAIRILA